MTSALKKLIDQARQACRCVQCLGGYPIGEHTISQPSTFARQGHATRPASCLASNAFDFLVANDHHWAHPEDKRIWHLYVAGETACGRVYERPPKGWLINPPKLACSDCKETA